MKNKEKLPLLHISDLSVIAGTTPVLEKINLTIFPGQIHVLIGPNGSGKSSLVHTIMGDQQYQQAGGIIEWKNKNIDSLSVDERARSGIFVTMQHPVIIPGLSVYALLKEAVRARRQEDFSLADFTNSLETAANLLDIRTEWLHRSYDTGFSGGQLKKLELLQMLVLKPELAVLDEIDSGLDRDAITSLYTSLDYYYKKNPTFSLLLITHNSDFIQILHTANIHVMKQAKIVMSGDNSLMQILVQRGYDAFCNT